jgi:hypothetical protein
MDTFQMLVICGGGNVVDTKSCLPYTYFAATLSPDFFVHLALHFFIFSLGDRFT